MHRPPCSDSGRLHDADTYAYADTGDPAVRVRVKRTRASAVYADCILNIERILHIKY